MLNIEYKEIQRKLSIVTNNIQDVTYDKPF